MSYILDALRRAESERERGSVPGLHSQTVPQTPAEPAPSRSLGPWAAAGVGGAVVLAGAAGWFLLRPGSDAVPKPMAAAPVAAPAAAPPVTAAPAVAPPALRSVEPAPAPEPAPVVAAGPAALPLPPARTVAPASAAKTPPPAEPAPVAAPPAALPSPARPAALPTRAAESATAAAPRSAQPDEVQQASVSPPAAAPVPAPAPRAEAARVINFEQLPEDVRRAIPPLAIGGAIYSDNAASRMLIVGGQLLHEGESAGPGVTLEQIKPRSAVLRWKQLRYEVSF